MVTHGRIGSEFLTTVTNTLGYCPLQIETLSVPEGSDIDRIDERAAALCTKLNTGDGVLVLTDVYGSTPSNVANRLCKRPEVAVVTGLNLPMLFRILNYPQLSLQELVQKAISGGHDGITACPEEPVQ